MFSRWRADTRFKVAVARIIIAATLALALLSGILPLNSFSSEPMCSMSCCAGLAPHPASSCSGGACHINVSIGKTNKAKHPEFLCGIDSIMASLHYASYSFEARANGESSRQYKTIASRTIMPPCEPGCGVSGSGFSQQQFSRDPATLAHSGRPRPPTQGTVFQHSDVSHNFLFFSCRASRPRPPPPVTVS